MSILFPRVGKTLADSHRGMVPDRNGHPPFAQTVTTSSRYNSQSFFERESLPVNCSDLLILHTSCQRRLSTSPRSILSPSLSLYRNPLENLFSLRVAWSSPDTWRNKTRHWSLYGSWSTGVWHAAK